MKIAVIGSGFTGATAARILAENGHQVSVFEKENYVGGMSADEKRNGTIVSKFGPHIFHTNDLNLAMFVNRFGGFKPIKHKVKAVTDKGILPWPINNVSMRAVFHIGEGASKEEIDKAWNEDRVRTMERITHLNTNCFEYVARQAFGDRLYNNFIKGYTECQWGRNASEIPASLFGRVRIEESNDNIFFRDKYVAIPRLGYTDMITKMLNHTNINILFGVKIDKQNVNEFLRQVYQVTINTATCSDLLDEEPLENIKVLFKRLNDNREYSTPVVNFCNRSDFTRVTDYHALNDIELLHDQQKEIIAEYPSHPDGVPLYPVRTLDNISLANSQIRELKKMNIISTGRLGGYRYINMDEAVKIGMEAAKEVMNMEDIL